MLRFALISLLALAGPAWAQVGNEIPAHLKSVDVEERLNGEVPLDLRFVDQRGNKVALGDYFVEDRPVILVMAYYRCPMLCSLVFDGMIDVLDDLEGVPGKDYQIVTVSIDPTETPTLAQAKRQTYLRAWGRPGADSGWHFLTGKKREIDRLAEAIGFSYEYLPKRKEYSHPALLTVLTPDARVSRYLYGVSWQPDTLRLALVEASDGAIGTTIERIILSCYRYDETEGRYAPVAMKIMRLGGGLTLVVVGLALYTFWRRERSRTKETSRASMVLDERNV